MRPTNTAVLVAPLSNNFRGRSAQTPWGSSDYLDALFGGELRNGGVPGVPQP